MPFDYFPVPMFIVRGAPGAGKSTFAKNLRGNSNAFITDGEHITAYTCAHAASDAVIINGILHVRNLSFAGS